MAESINDKQKETIKDAVQRFVEARLQGREPDINEFVEQYPGLERQIKEAIQDVQRIDVLFDSLVQADDGDFEEPAFEHDLVGRKVGSFEVVETIGQGGMGVVYLARDTKLKRDVAVKSMPARLAGDSTAKMRFRREAELLASLNHPNVAVIHGIAEEGQSSYLILEYVLGETLAERIARKRFELDEALSIGRQIAGAISAAHKKGIVHRDLKPGNIKITPDGQVKVLDFGLAKAALGEGTLTESTVTQPGRVLGTPAYMSPEQARGKQTDHRTDIWSFGCIMFQMLTGHIPFEGETATDTLARIIEREPDWKVLPQSTPANVRALIRRCLEKDSCRRPDDIAKAITEITRTLSAPLANRPRRLTRTATFVGAALIIVMTAVGVWFAVNWNTQPSSSEIRLVVLPFENLGWAEPDYFVNGLTDEVRTRIGDIHGLLVIGRQSSMQYKNSQISARQIGKDLSVDYLLEGTIRRQRRLDPNSPVKVNIRLVRASDESQVWVLPNHDDMRDILDFQSEVAELVAQELDIKLLAHQRKALARRRTENKEAYDLYLKGNAYFRGTHDSEDGTIDAVKMYQEAIELDPKFAAAHAMLSRAHMRMYWFGIDRTDERLAEAEKAAHKALTLDPDLPDAHVAMARYYYQGYFEYDTALKRLDSVRRRYPNHVDMLYWTGNVNRRQGTFEDAVKNHSRALQFDPLNPNIAVELGIDYLCMRNYSEADRYFRRTIQSAPVEAVGYVFKAWLHLCWDGNTGKARTALMDGLQKTETMHHRRIIDSLVRVDVFDEYYEEALAKLAANREDYDELDYFLPYCLRCALIYSYMDDKEDLAKKNFNEARIILLEKIKEEPQDDRYYSALGIACAGLGLDKEAIENGRKGIEKLPPSKDASRYQTRHEDMARIYVMLGDYNQAVDKLLDLLTAPGDFSLALLKRDPAWALLRKHSRYNELLEAGK